MPRARASMTASKSEESEKLVDTEEQVDLGADNDMEEEEPFEEEVEYEEVEEEVEEEEVEEEEEIEEVVEEDDEEVENGAQRQINRKVVPGDDDMENAEGEEDLGKRYSELLALPPHGSEVYLGGIPQAISDDDLKRFCETVGDVTEVRVMRGKDSMENKGYAFVTFKTKELALSAIEVLNGAEFKGKKLKCSSSQAKHKLFIGNVPKNWLEEDLKKVVNGVGPGVITVELLKDQLNSSRNRGYAFVEYYNHACAEYSREKMSNPKFKLDDNTPTVSWADSKGTDSSSSQVKAVYVKNLPKDVRQDELKEVFEHFGKITKIVLPPPKLGKEKSRYGFVHFAEKSSAMKALNSTEKYEIGGQVLECSLAKPQADQKTSGGLNSNKSSMFPTYPPRMGYGLAGAPYGGLGSGFAGGGFAQPFIYGRGAAPGMAMMPMLLPDGRIGYVLQQPGLQAHAPPPSQRGGSRSSGSGSSSEGRHGSGDNSSSSRGRNRRYNPY